MWIRIATVSILVLSLAGCAAGRRGATVDETQVRVSDMEKDLEEKNAEIEDLKDQVRDLDEQLKRTKPASAPAPVERSSSAKDVQTALKNAGLYSGSVDGKIGSGTKKAIREFQESNGLKADGVIGQKTWDKLKTYLDE